MTTTAEQRAAYVAAKAKLDEIESQRAELLKPTDAAYLAAAEAVELALEACGDLVATCESCSEPIFVGDRMLGGETPLCDTCAPTYDRLLSEPEYFCDSEGVPLTGDAARALYDAHIAAGGRPEDSMAEVVT